MHEQFECIFFKFLKEKIMLKSH